MKSKKYNIQAKLLLSTLLYLLSLTLPHLKAQDTIQLWQRITEGKFDITNNYQVGSYVVMTTVLDKGSKPAIIGGKNSYQPLSVWDLELDTFVAFTHNWTGAPINPMLCFKFNDSTFYITDKEKMYKTDVDLINKSIKYTQVFQGLESIDSDKKVIYGAYFGKNYLYFWGHHFIHLFDTSGNFIRSLRNYEDGEKAILQTTSVVEYENNIYFGYDYVGGLADGSGLAILDPNTGQITKLRDPLWMNNANGCKIAVIEGKFYLETDPGLYFFEPTLFEYKDGAWKTVIVGGLLPKEKYGKVSVLVRPDGRYANGDTINKTKGGIDYDFTNGIIGKSLPREDPRTLIQFSEEFKTEFWQSHGNMPYIDFIYELGSKTIGFGANIVAELVNINTSAVKSAEMTRLSVYPNPAKSIIHISGLQKAIEYEVYSLLGIRMLHGSTLNAINVSSLPSGLFLLKTPLGCAKVVKE